MTIMDKVIYSKFDKDALKNMPIACFPGKIVTVITENEANKAVDYLLTKNILGVDTETRPSFKKGQQHKVSLLQVAADDICYLFRLNIIGMVPSVIKLLSNKQVPMIGLSWHDDICSLKRRKDFESGFFIDIQEIVSELGIEDKSLQKLYANLFHKKISKRQRLSNWDIDVLSDKQKLYAATDAWACIKLYQEILRLKETGAFILKVTPDKNNKIEECNHPIIN